jgi:hypothetical protein
MVLSEEPSDYAELSARLNPLVPPPPEAWWFVNPPDREGLRWERLSLPALSGCSLEVLKEAVQARGDSRLVSISQPLTYHEGLGTPRIVDWGSGEWSRACPNRLAVVNTSPLVIVPQYVVLPRGIRKSAVLFKVEFPPVWSSLAALNESSAWLWNRDHPLVRAVEEQDVESFGRYNSLRFSENLLQTRGRSALCLMEILGGLLPEEGRERAEDYRPGFWRDLWDRVALEPAEIVTWDQRRNGNGTLVLFGPEGLERIPATDPRIPQYLPDPGDEWKLTIEYKDGSVGGA